MKIARRKTYAAAALAVVALLAFPQRGLQGAEAGGRTAGARSGHRFMLFLYEGSGFDRSGSHVAEYTAWAGSVRRSGAAVSGDEIATGPTAALERDSVEIRSDGDPDSEKLAGYFIVEAASLERAVRVAKGCPHLKYGGRIVVAPIAD